MNGVIINCDAMQSYNALHCLTAQPDAEEQAQAPHRLYGHLHPSTHYSAADWRANAIREIESAWENNQTPIICGGTGFYLKALTEGLSPIPEIPEEVRKTGIELQIKMGNPSFHEALKKRDPLTAANLDPMNTQRNVRAWEVLEHTGKPLAEWQNEPLIGAPEGWVFQVTALFPDREKSIEKINARLNQMLDCGILDEVRALDSLIQSGEVAEDALIALVLITVLRLPPLLHPPMSVLGEEALPWMDLPAFAGTDMEYPILFPPLLPPGFVASVVVIEPGVVVAGIVGPVLD